MNDWNEVAEIIGGEIEKNGRCAAETAWTLAGHLIKDLDIPGLKKKSNSKLDVTFAVKVIPELSRFVSKQGRGQGIVLKSSISVVETGQKEQSVVENASTTTLLPEMAETKPESKQVKIVDPTNEFVGSLKLNDPEDSGFSTIPGSLLGRADDPRRPNLLPNFGDWAKKKEEEPAFDTMIIKDGDPYPEWEIPRTNRLRGVIQTVHIVAMIQHVFAGVEDDLGQINFQGKQFLLSEENLAMFKKALWFVFGASHVMWANKK